MSELQDYRLLSFDVYGTLIDWETGILEALQPLLRQTTLSKSQALDLFHELEAAQQRKAPDQPYSELLATVYPQLAARNGLAAPTSEESRAFGHSVGKWPAFPDTIDALGRLSKYYKLLVLSNVDKKSFSATNAGPLEGIEFDSIITAQDVGSYKPDPKNFEYMLQSVKDQFGIGKGQILQTAQSQYHDHHPAWKLGIKSVWIQRDAVMGNRSEEIYDWRFKTLGEMADAVEKEVFGD